MIKQRRGFGISNTTGSSLLLDVLLFLENLLVFLRITSNNYFPYLLLMSNTRENRVSKGIESITRAFHSESYSYQLKRKIQNLHLATCYDYSVCGFLKQQTNKTNSPFIDHVSAFIHWHKQSKIQITNISNNLGYCAGYDYEQFENTLK